jgi:hypothetical protein
LCCLTELGFDGRGDEERAFEKGEKEDVIKRLQVNSYQHLNLYIILNP